MANSIALITKYLASQLDEKLIQDSVTGILESGAYAEFVGVNAVKVPSITLSGLGDYSKTSGFPSGDVNWTWETLTLSKDRAKTFSVDAVDDDEAGGVFMHLAKQFIRTKVAPEKDAYFLSSIYAKAQIAGVASETVAANTIISKFATALKYFADNGVPTDNCVIYVSTAVMQLLRTTTELSKWIQTSNVTIGNVTTTIRAYENIPIIEVEPVRFKTAYTFGTDGFTAASGATDINFMFVNKDCVIPILKHEKVRVFSPDMNQTADAYKFDYRLHYDIFVPANKTYGIYVSKVAA